MKNKALYLCCGMALLMLTYSYVRAEDTDDTRIQTEQQQIDNDKSANTDDQKIDALAKQFHVRESTVRELRSQGQGWGEITIGLATARELEKTDPKAYPTLSAALKKVETLRASGDGWGKIAKDLGFKLGPVVAAAHHTRHELHEDLHHEALHEEKDEHHEHEEVEEHEGMHHDPVEHPELLEHPEHPELPDRPGH